MICFTVTYRNQKLPYLLEFTIRQSSEEEFKIEAGVNTKRGVISSIYGVCFFKLCKNFTSSSSMPVALETKYDSVFTKMRRNRVCCETNLPFTVPNIFVETGSGGRP